jgi:hypothetical protein
MCSLECACNYSIIKSKKEKEKLDKIDWDKRKIDFLSIAKLKSMLQININNIVRHIDYGQKCISCPKNLLSEKFDAGHLFRVKTHDNLRYNLLNIYAQCTYCNKYLNGNELNYLLQLQSNFDGLYVRIILRMPSDYKLFKISRIKIIKAIEYSKLILKDMQKKSILSNKERIDLREMVNGKIGIY